jgi:hypothetical protein
MIVVTLSDPKAAHFAFGRYRETPRESPFKECTIRLLGA